MKYISRFFFLFILFASCQNETNPNATDQETSDSVATDSSAEMTVSPYEVEYDETTHALNLVRNKENIGDSDAADVIRVLNKKYRDIKLDLVKAGTDTLEVKIDEASTLTQGMGSTGAEAYLAELTYSFTELKGVKAVKIDFEEGDHAMPGVYTRDDFKSLLKGN